MGGSESEDFLAPSGAGENTLVTCENGDYAADMDVAQGIPRAPTFPDALDAPVEIETPGADTIEKLAAFLEIDEAATSKAMPVTKPDGTVVLALVRGDDRLSEDKLLEALGTDFAPSTEDEIRAAFGAERRLARPGRLRGRGRSPTRRCARGSSSPARTATAGTCAASRRAATTSRASPTSATHEGGRHAARCAAAS